MVYLCSETGIYNCNWEWRSGGDDDDDYDISAKNYNSAAEGSNKSGWSFWGPVPSHAPPPSLCPPLWALTVISVTKCELFFLFLSGFYIILCFVTAKLFPFLFSLLVGWADSLFFFLTTPSSPCFLWSNSHNWPIFLINMHQKSEMFFSSSSSSPGRFAFIVIVLNAEVSLQPVSISLWFRFRLPVVSVLAWLFGLIKVVVA